MSNNCKGRFIKQMPGDLEMEMRRLVVLKDEAEDLPGAIGVEVKSTVDQLDLGNAFLHQQEQVTFNAFHRVGANLVVPGA